MGDTVALVIITIVVLMLIIGYVIYRNYYGTSTDTTTTPVTESTTFTWIYMISLLMLLVAWFSLLYFVFSEKKRMCAKRQMNPSQYPSYPMSCGVQRMPTVDPELFCPM